MKKVIVLILVIIFSACKEKETCYPEFRESLAYLKEFSNPKDNKLRLTDEIFRNIEVVESISGILNQDDGGNLIRHIVVTQKDIDKWEKWITKNCDSLNQKASEKQVSIKSIPESVDYHKIIDLTVENHYKNEIEQYNFDIKYIGENDNEALNDLEYVIKNTDSKSQSDLIKRLIIEPVCFEFSKAKLNSKTNKLLTFKEVKTKDKIVYIFNSFLSNESKDSIVANISVIYTNEEYGGVKGGWEEIAFFSKENNIWKSDKRIEFIEY